MGGGEGLRAIAQEGEGAEAAHVARVDERRELQRQPRARLPRGVVHRLLGVLVRLDGHRVAQRVDDGHAGLGIEVQVGRLVEAVVAGQVAPEQLRERLARDLHLDRRQEVIGHHEGLVGQRRLEVGLRRRRPLRQLVRLVAPAGERHGERHDEQRLAHASPHAVSARLSTSPASERSSAMGRPPAPSRCTTAAAAAIPISMAVSMKM
jgi:hypothetical protein